MSNSDTCGRGSAGAVRVDPVIKSVGADPSLLACGACRGRCESPFCGLARDDI